MTIHEGFPLGAFAREIAERNKQFAEELLEASIEDVRRLIGGEPRSDFFKPDLDPVDLVVQHATQVELCRIVLHMDEEAKAEKSE